MSAIVTMGKSSPRLASFRVDGSRDGGPHAATKDVRTNYEETVGVERPAGTNHYVPPAWLAGNGMRVCHMLIACQRVADQDGVGFGGIQLAVGLISDLQRSEIDPGVEPQRIAGGKTHDQRMRMVRLALAIGAIERGVGFDHSAFPASWCPPLWRWKGVNRPLTSGVNDLLDWSLIFLCFQA